MYVVLQRKRGWIQNTEGSKLVAKPSTYVIANAKVESGQLFKTRNNKE
jgi:hypothetical protein